MKRKQDKRYDSRKVFLAESIPLDRLMRELDEEEKQEKTS